MSVSLPQNKCNHLRGGGARKKCVVNGAFDRSTFGCAVIVLAPRFKPKPFLTESKGYMQTRLLAVVECVRVFAWSEALAIQVYYWRTAQHSSTAQAQYSTALLSTAQPHSTAHAQRQHRHNTAQYSTAQPQHSTAQHRNLIFKVGGTL